MKKPDRVSDYNDHEPVTWFTFFSHREKREYYYEPISGTTTWIAPSPHQGVISRLPGSPVESAAGNFYQRQILPIITKPSVAISMFLFNFLLLSVWIQAGNPSRYWFISLSSSTKPRPSLSIAFSKHTSMSLQNNILENERQVKVAAVEIDELRDVADISEEKQFDLAVDSKDDRFHLVDDGKGINTEPFKMDEMNAESFVNTGIAVKHDAVDEQKEPEIDQCDNTDSTSAPTLAIDDLSDQTSDSVIETVPSPLFAEEIVDYFEKIESRAVTDWFEKTSPSEDKADGENNIELEKEVSMISPEIDEILMSVNSGADTEDTDEQVILGTVELIEFNVENNADNEDNIELQKEFSMISPEIDEILPSVNAGTDTEANDEQIALGTVEFHEFDVEDNAKNENNIELEKQVSMISLEIDEILPSVNAGVDTEATDEQVILGAVDLHEINVIGAVDKASDDEAVSHSSADDLVRVDTIGDNVESDSTDSTMVAPQPLDTTDLELALIDLDIAFQLTAIDDESDFSNQENNSVLDGSDDDGDDELMEGIKVNAHDLGLLETEIHNEKYDTGTAFGGAYTEMLVDNGGIAGIHSDTKIGGEQIAENPLNEELDSPFDQGFDFEGEEFVMGKGDSPDNVAEITIGINWARKEGEVVLKKIVEEATAAGFAIDLEPDLRRLTLSPLVAALLGDETISDENLCNLPLAGIDVPHCKSND